MSQHVVSTRVYFSVFTILLALTGATVAASSVDLGRLNAVVALTIAGCKAVLVILYFMHIRYSPRLTWVVLSGGFLWLTILIVFTLSDELTRSQLPGLR